MKPTMSEIWGAKETVQLSFWESTAHIAPFVRRAATNIEVNTSAHISRKEIEDACLYIHQRLVGMNVVLSSSLFEDVLPGGTAYTDAVVHALSLSRGAYQAICKLEAGYFKDKSVNRCTLMSLETQLQDVSDESMAMAVVIQARDNQAEEVIGEFL